MDSSPQQLPAPPKRTPVIDVEQLRAHLRQLVTLEETEAPVVSLYLGVRDAHRTALSRRVRVLRRAMTAREAAPFEEAIARIERYLDTELARGTRGVAIFARGGARPFFDALQFQVPLPDRLSLAPTPCVYELVELKDTYHRYVILLATEEQARILEVHLGAVIREIWTQRPDAAVRRIGTEAARERYQNHRHSRNDHFLAEKLELLEQLMDAGGHTHLVLAGDPRVVGRVKDALPPRLAAKLFDMVAAAPGDQTDDIVAATLSSFVAQEELESLDAVALLLREVRRGSLAAIGAEACLDALERGQVDLLLLAGDYRPTPGWACRTCGKIDPAPARPALCIRCGDAATQTVDVREALVKLAERTGAGFEHVRHSEALMELGGVGCLLRYQLEPAFSAADG